MNIQKIILKNCLGVESLDFQPKQITLIEGKKGSGKTSILESLQRIFLNKSERPEFVKTEGEKAETYLLLDDATHITKYISKDNKATTCKVEKANAVVKAPETYLKGLVNEVQFNPINLISMKDKELSDLVLSLMPIEVTPEDVEAWIDRRIEGVSYQQHGLAVIKSLENLLYDTRTEKNRLVLSNQNAFKETIVNVPKDFKVEDWDNVNLKDIYDELNSAKEVNAKIERAEHRIEITDSEIAKLESRAEAELNRIEEQIKILKKDQDAVVARLDEDRAKEVAKKEAAKKFLEENEEIDTFAIDEKYSTAETMKSYIPLYEKAMKFESLVSENQEESDELTRVIEILRKKPQELLAKTEVPMDGITISDEGKVLINGRPILNLSGGERIEFSLNLVKALAGDLKVILIDGFEALDKDSQEEFIKRCEGDGYQYFITNVTEGAISIKTK